MNERVEAKAKWRRYILGGCLVILLVLGVTVAVNYYIRPHIVTTATITNEIKSISILETLEYDYTLASNIDIKDNLFIVIPVDKADSIYEYSGCIVFGVDCSKIEIEKEQNTFIVTLPEAEMVSHEIYTDSYDVIVGENRKMTNEAYLENQQMDKEKAEEAAIAQGCAERALANAEEQLEELILYLKNDPGGEEYTVVFNVVEE
ncbi:MAG: DUF4230 domain-containing protein [Lachnospiraceae bacterium]|nr:DUF4230 domain-containing protein [Lachnospiraceae bacterium]